MSESWSELFNNLGGVISKGVQLAGDIVNQIEIAFHANQRRGVGILWLPKSGQALYYSLDWRTVDLDFRSNSDLDLHLANIMVGLSMWQGIILCHRALMVREPVVKVAIPDLSYADRIPRMGSQGDESELWSIVKKLKEDLFTQWTYVSTASRRDDEKFQKVETLLREGQLFATGAASFQSYSYAKCNPRDTLQYVLPIIPASCGNRSTLR